MPERRPRVPVAVLLSGGGTNMAALLYASRLPDCPYDIVLVASNNPAAGGLKLAAAEGIATFALPHKGMARADHDAAMEAAVLDAGARFIAMAGYMRILGEDFVTRWRDQAAFEAWVASPSFAHGHAGADRPAPHGGPVSVASELWSYDVAVVAPPEGGQGDQG